MDGLHGPPLTCVCSVICSATGSCSSQRQLLEEHLLGLHQPEPPASWEEGREVVQGRDRAGRGNTGRKAGDPSPGASPHQALAPTVALYFGDDAWLLPVPNGILEELCDYGLIT